MTRRQKTGASNPRPGQGFRRARDHEQSFCADVKSWCDAMFKSRADLPFSGARVEEYGPPGSQKRHDLRIFDAQGRIALTGEVKLPGTPEGRSAYDEALLRDACDKADRIGGRFFFTWNVKELVLWDRSRWNVPAYERRVRAWPLDRPPETREELALPEIRARIRDVFLPRFFSDFAEIYMDRNPEWGMRPDEFFVGSLNSHLDWPVILTRDWLAERSDRSRAFSAKLESWMAKEQQWTFTRSDDREWRAVIERAARTLCYVLSNRMIFYEAVRKRFPKDLKGLTIARRSKDPESVYHRLNRQFHKAVRLTGDYETIFPTAGEDKVGKYVFCAPGAIDAWRGVVAHLGNFNLREIRHDIVGGIFQKLISPEERHRFGQHYTHEDIVDVINAFCIRKADAAVLDPACGSGSFLVRAYHRKAFLDPSKTHQRLLEELFGCDIALFAAHLATLNLAARNITDEENYPYVARKNFFEVERKKPFWKVPEPHSVGGRKVKMRDVFLPELDAVVGNPPYVRQELIPKKGRKGAADKQSKEWLAQVVRDAWGDIKFSGRSDLYLYFWLASCRFLKDSAKEGNRDAGYFGFLTSSSWLDVAYGFPLQQWILKRFKLVAVIESVDEPWFEDARVKTCVTILQRCSDEEARESNLVRFVRVLKPLSDVLGERPDENARQRAAEELRQTVLGHRNVHEFHEDGLVRIITKKQSDLWEEGRDRTDPGSYAGGKWGRYLRAPDYYFEIMKEFGHRFVRLGDIAEIRRGVTSGCDAFFMPHDVTEEYLNEYPDAMSWRRAPLVRACVRKEVASGKVRIVKAGDGSVHPIEAKYLEPEVHSLMEIDRPVVRAADCRRVILLAGEPKSKLRGTYVLKYIGYGERQTFASGKSKAVPVPERSTCAARPRWYDVTGHATAPIILPKIQQYRMIAPLNVDGLQINCSLMQVWPRQGVKSHVLAGLLNSTWLVFAKSVFTRGLGVEGNVQLDVYAADMMDCPDPRRMGEPVLTRIESAVDALSRRASFSMVEDDLMSCHSPERAREIAMRPIELPEELRQPDRRALDDAVFELLGVANPGRRRELVNELYSEVTLFFRQIRIVEIQKQEQRTKTKARRFSAEELAAGVWDSLSPDEKKPLAEWLAEQPAEKREVVVVAGPAELIEATALFDTETVYFGRGKQRTHKVYPDRATAEFVEALSNLGFQGVARVPSEGRACRKALVAFRERMERLEARFEELASGTTGTERLADDVVRMLVRWSLMGK